MQLEPLIKKDISNRANRLAGVIKKLALCVKHNGSDIEILHLILTIIPSYELLLVKLDDAIRMHLNIILHTPLPHDKATEELQQYLENLRIRLPQIPLRDFHKVVKELYAKKILP